MIGIFNARVVIQKNAEGALEVELDGATDAAGFGEALGFAASCWLTSTANPEQHEREMLVMIGAFITLAKEKSGAKGVQGSVEIIDTGGTIPPGGRVS